MMKAALPGMLIALSLAAARLSGSVLRFLRSNTHGRR